MAALGWVLEPVGFQHRVTVPQCYNTLKPIPLLLKHTQTLRASASLKKKNQNIEPIHYSRGERAHVGSQLSVINNLTISELSYLSEF